MKNSLYHFLESNPVTSEYVSRIRKRMELYRPNGGRENNERTLELVLAAWAVSAGSFLFLVYFGGLSFSYLCGVICIIFAINMNEIYRRLEKEEIKLLGQFEKFIADVRFHFGFHGMAEESVLEALENAEREIGLHAEVMYRMLTEEKDENRDNIMQNVPNHYFGTFYLLCETVMKYGDKKSEGKSLFLGNLSCLKQEINLEVLRRRKLEYLFSGLAGISLMPVFAIKPIEKWAVGSMQEMASYYDGQTGTLSTLAVCGASMAICFAIHKLRYETRPLHRESRLLNRMLEVRSINAWITGSINRNYSKYMKKSESLKSAGQIENIKEFMLKQAVFAIIGFLLSVFILQDIQKTGREQTVSDIALPYEAELALDREGAEALKLLIRDYAESGEEMTAEIMRERFPDFRNGEAEAAIEAAEKILAEYYKIRFGWKELIIAAAAGTAAYWWPWLWVLIKKKMMMMEREQEVIRFQAVILVLMHMDGMSVEVMLSHMEDFAHAFKNTIGKALDAMEYEGMEALEKMRERETFLPFIRLADAFIACDRLPIYEAFDEIASDRNYYLEKYRQESDALASDKAALGRMLGFIPLQITIGCKLVIPFVLEGLNRLSLYGGSPGGF